MSDRSGHGPLVIFTSLAIGGAGLAAASAYFELVYRRSFAPAVAIGAALLGAGLVVSIAHLGQKQRAGLAVRGAGRSALSNEVLLAGLALASAAFAAGLDLADLHATAATAVAGALNALFLLAIGLVYRVRGQLTWRGFTTFTALTGGLAFGAITVQSLAPAGGLFQGTLVLVAIDALVFLQRWRDLAGAITPSDMMADAWLARRDRLLGARFFLLDVVPAILLVVGPTPIAVAAAATGLIADRIGFYRLAVQHGTEREIAAVEAAIEGLDRRSSD